MLKIHNYSIPIDIDKFTTKDLIVIIDHYNKYCMSMHSDNKTPLSPSAYLTYSMSEIVRAGGGGYESIEKLYNDYIDLVGQKSIVLDIKEMSDTWDRYKNSGKKIKSIY